MGLDCQWFVPRKKSASEAVGRSGSQIHKPNKNLACRYAPHGSSGNCRMLRRNQPAVFFVSFAGRTRGRESFLGLVGQGLVGVAFFFFFGMSG